MQRGLWMPSYEWQRIVGQSDANTGDDFETLKKEAYLDYLNRSSDRMMKPWKNSVESKLRRVVERRSAKRNEAAMVRNSFIQEMRHQMVTDHEDATNQAKAVHFTNKHDTIELNNALLFSNVLKHWDAQVAFKKKLKGQEEQRENARCAEEQKKYQDWLQEERQKRHKKILKHQVEMRILKDQMDENFERMTTAKQNDVERERVDNEKAQKELATVKEFENNLKLKQFAKNKQVLADNEEQIRMKKEKQSKKDLLEDELNHIYQEAKYRMECMFKKREKEMFEERRRIREEISRKVAATVEIDTEKDDRILREAREKMDKEDEEKAKREGERDVERKKEMRDAYLEHLKDQAKKDRKHLHMKMWERENCLRNLEMSQAYEEQVTNRKMKMMQEHRENILRQIQEEKATRSQEEVDLKKFYNEDAIKEYAKNDKEFFKYADELREECKADGYSVVPVEKMIKEYKKQYNLLPPPILPRHLKTHFQPRSMEKRPQEKLRTECIQSTNEDLCTRGRLYPCNCKTCKIK